MAVGPRRFTGWGFSWACVRGPGQTAGCTAIRLNARRGGDRRLPSVEEIGPSADPTPCFPRKMGGSSADVVVQHPGPYSHASSCAGPCIGSRSGSGGVVGSLPSPRDDIEAAAPMNESPAADELSPELEPVTFHVRRSGFWLAVGFAPLFLVMAAMLGSLVAMVLRAPEGAGEIIAGAVFAISGMAVGAVPIWMIRRERIAGEVVIDPVRGQVRIARTFEVPFSQVRQVEVLWYDSARRLGPEVDTSSFFRGWALDIGGSNLLVEERGLSRDLLEEIADALKVRVDAYRARNGEGVDPLPPPDKAFLERLAGALHYEGQTFEENWLALDGPMAELMRDYDEEPDERTMGRDGEFAKALRQAGYDLGDPPLRRATYDARGTDAQHRPG
jgi:hypothetical protein